MKSESLGQMLSPEEVARRLEVSRSTVWRLLRQGKIGPAARLGHRTTRIPERSVAAYVAASLVPGPFG